jgi:alpha-galactosidase
MVFNLCQYGMGEVWNWGGDTGGHSWRTTGDLGWEKATRLPGFYTIGFLNAAHAEPIRPGRWNDPDYILIGSVGDARNTDAPPKYTRLIADEQYSYMSMWSLMAAPLFFSGDMGHLDEFTLNVLCNAEVIDVDQDALGKQGRVVRKTDDEFVLAKPLADGSVAVGLFNLSEAPKAITVTWADLELSGKRTVRDVWRQKDVGPAEAKFTAMVNRHGVAFVKLSAAAK